MNYNPPVQPSQKPLPSSRKAASADGSASRLALWLALTGIALGAVLQILHVLLQTSAVDGDEAIVGLMAKHILEGREVPVFYYGQHYFGALEAYLTAAVFGLLGISATTLRLVPLLASLSIIALVYRLAGRTWSDSRAWAAAALAALPSLFYFDLTLRTRGGFPESYALMLLAGCMALQWTHRDAVGRGTTWALGLLCGFLLYLYQAALFHIAAIAAATLLFRDRPPWRTYLRWTGGVLLGAMPLLVYNLVYPLQTVMQAAGVKYLGMEVSDYRELGLLRACAAGVGRRLEALPQGLENLWTAMAGRPLWESGWPQVLLAALWAAALLATAWSRRRKVRDLLRRRLRFSDVDGADLCLLLLAVTFAAGFPLPRYLLFCYPLAAVLMAGFLPASRPASEDSPPGRGLAWLPVAALAAILVLNAVCIADKMAGAQPSTDYHRVIADLDALGLNRGYADYWLAYPVNFFSGERILLSPRAGPVSLDRYPAYTRTVDAARRVVFIFESGSAAESDFLEQVQRLGETPQNARSGRFSFYYNLSSPVRRQLRMPFGVDGDAGTSSLVVPKPE